MTYAECEYQCQRVGMIIPESQSTLLASKGTGCGFDG